MINRERWLAATRLRHELEEAIIRWGEAKELATEMESVWGEPFRSPIVVKAWEVVVEKLEEAERVMEEGASEGARR